VNRRVRVTATRARVRRPEALPASREIDEQTALGSAYMDSLIGAQLRLALRVLSATVGVLVLVPALFVLIPPARSAQLLGVPLPWLGLGVLVYPALWVAARYYVRQAERHEKAFTDLVSRP
jgi:hypothetical protein